MLNKIKEHLVEGKTLLQFGLVNTVGQGLGMVAPLVIAKFLSPEMFGSYSLGKMIVFFFLMVFISSAQIPFVVSANQERVSSGRINKSFSIQCLFIAAGLCVFAVVVAPMSGYLSAFAKIDGREFMFVCLAFAGFATQNCFVNLFMAMGQRIRSSLVELTFGTLTVGLVFAFYWAGAISLKNLFLIHFTSAVVVALIFIWAIDFEKLRPFVVDGKYLKDMFYAAKWMVIGSTAAFVVAWGDSIVLRVFNKPFANIGTYNLGYGIFKGVSALILLIHTYFLPFVSEHINDGEKMKNYLFNKRPKIFLLVSGVIALLFVITPGLLRMIYGEFYRDSVTVLRILLVACVLLLYIVFYEPIFYSLRKYKFIQAATMFQALVNLVLDILLVPAWGMIGAATATVSAYFCRAVISGVYFRVKLKRQMKL
jgi:O-antigen/teichoic acid export membrane protein